MVARPLPLGPSATLSSMPASLSAERFGQLAAAVEALRAGDSSLKTAKDVHGALTLDPVRRDA